MKSQVNGCYDHQIVKQRHVRHYKLQSLSTGPQWMSMKFTDQVPWLWAYSCVHSIKTYVSVSLCAGPCQEHYSMGFFPWHRVVPTPILGLFQRAHVDRKHTHGCQKWVELGSGGRGSVAIWVEGKTGWRKLVSKKSQLAEVIFCSGVRQAYWLAWGCLLSILISFSLVVTEGNYLNIPLSASRFSSWMRGSQSMVHNFVRSQEQFRI